LTGHNTICRSSCHNLHLHLLVMNGHIELCNNPQQAALSPLTQISRGGGG